MFDDFILFDSQRRIQNQTKNLCFILFILCYFVLVAYKTKRNCILKIHTKKKGIAKYFVLRLFLRLVCWHGSLLCACAKKKKNLGLKNAFYVCILFPCFDKMKANNRNLNTRNKHTIQTKNITNKPTKKTKKTHKWQRIATSNITHCLMNTYPTKL